MAKKHIHKYHKIELAGQMLWACALPDCGHHMPKHYENSVIGKYSFCWTCPKQFRLTPENMVDDMPRCDDCRAGITPEKPLVQFDFDNLSDIIGRK